MERFNCLSTMLYHRMNEIIGNREMVSIRRDFYDINDTFHDSTGNSRQMLSGSKREGLDMTGSDTDMMIWLSDHYVICETTQSYYYNTAKDTLFLAEHGLTRPGFVFLRLLHQACTEIDLHLFLSCISLHNHIYISSSKYRQSHNQNMRSMANFDLHGPCTSGYIDGHEIDVAHCFHCLHWPPQAFPWLQRCQQLCWPRPSVLQDITHGGCHFVAIGAKQSIFENMEWRLSFSQAEQKLIYSFNHSQLLVYGLLKLFLKEVLNSGIPENQKLLCSYFMKTALFWQIQDDILIHWSIDNFLSCFWNCFKLLIKWVNCQYCPNFFVPENNMFFPKITGRDQQRLLSQLLDLYNEGIECLLRCPSIQDQINSAIFSSTLNLTYGYQLSDYRKDIILHKCLIGPRFNKSYTSEDHMKIIYFLMMKFRSSITQAQHLILYSNIIYQCQELALFQQMKCIHGSGNAEMYRLKKQSLHLLKQTSRLGCLTDMIYLAMHYYIDGRYTHALCLLHEVKSKLYRPHVMYYSGNHDIYIQAMGGKSLSTKIKEASACDIFIPHVANLLELRLELRVLESLFIPCNIKPRLTISPFVFVHFLTFLCHHHLDNTQQRQKALQDIHTLVHSDDHRYIVIPTKYSAWQLLGICHQMNQNPQQALQCYKKSLIFTGDLMLLFLSKATHYRIKSLERQLIQQHITEPPLD